MISWPHNGLCPDVFDGHLLAQIVIFIQHKKAHAEDAGKIGVALSRLPDLRSLQVVLHGDV
jgi:hypothetical protein